MSGTALRLFGRAFEGDVNIDLGIDRRGTTAGLRPASYMRPVFAALDLGTNNCRLLVARPVMSGGFRVIDAFSRIVRLGEGVSRTRMLSDAAMERSVAALRICAAKLEGRGATGGAGG